MAIVQGTPVTRTPANLRPGARAERKAPLDRGCRDPGQHRRLRHPRVWPALTRCVVHHAPPSHQTTYAALDDAEQVVHLRVTRGCGEMKAHSATPVLGEDAIEHQRVRMYVHVEGCPEALDDRDCPTPPVHHALRAGSPSQVPQHRPDEHPDRCPAQRMVPGQHVAQAMRHGQHPLAHRHVREHMVNEMRGALRHPAPATTGTDRSPPTRERHEPVKPAAAAVESGEAAGEPSAAQKAPKLLVDEPG